MSDYSAAVPWLTTGLCCLFSVGIGKQHRKPGSSNSVLLAGLKALGLGFASIFLASIFHSVCIGTLQICKGHGDGNIGFVVPSFFASPIYWLLIVLVSKIQSQPVLALADPHEAASSRALLQHYEGTPASSKCPSCGQVITVMQESTGGRKTHLITKCQCSRSNARFRLQRGEA